MFDSTCSKKVPVWKPGKLFLGAAAVVGLPGVPPPAAEVSVSRKDGRFDGLKSLQMELQVWVSNKFQNKNYATWSLTRLWKKSISFLQPFTSSIGFFLFVLLLDQIFAHDRVLQEKSIKSVTHSFLVSNFWNLVTDMLPSNLQPS